MQLRYLPSLLIIGLAGGTSGYTWPDARIDHVESLLYEQKGSASALSPALEVNTCDRVPNQRPRNGRTNSAEWLRLAYHDMATANVHEGTGGIDASIGFEFQDRAENPGMAFSASLDFFTQFQSPRSSMADLIALGAIFALGSCSAGRIIVPFRAGRIDATEPGPFGVPEPQQDLASHTASFERQGFSVEEMIGLVACGHTLGGVHGNDFPTIVDQPNDPAFDDNRHDFDNTFQSFDNHVAVQFVNNETQNPLAFGPNETTRSDFRIFNADGGVLIRQMAESSDLFDATCQSLIERMINTVPKVVELTELVTPIPVKPGRIEFQVFPNATMRVTGEIRILNDGSTSENRSVFLDFKTRDSGSFSAPTVLSVTKLDSYYTGTPTFTVYSFSVNTATSTGVLSFNVRIEDQGSVAIVADNGGNGFPLTDAIFPLPLASCQNSNTVQGVANTFNLTVAVRDDAELSDLIISVPWPTAQNGSVVAQFVTKEAPLTRKAVQTLEGTGYTLYGGAFSDLRNKFFHVQKNRYDVRGTGPNGIAESTFNLWERIPVC
ncbi:heme peroxidase [Thozetella sp. PMI_491]|nr:heme peroxidase [Thozetella sp. PMI_491]